MSATLVLDNVARHFGGVPAVDGVSLQVPAGQITGLIGPNGAGKTTVVNLITGILHLTPGHVLLDGQDVSKAEAPYAGACRSGAHLPEHPAGARCQRARQRAGRLSPPCETGLWANLLGLPSARAETRQMRERRCSCWSASA
jgi:branched-chain amino acid transport system ATP-binding protein